MKSKQSKYAGDIIEEYEILNQLLYKKDESGEYILRGSTFDGDDGGEFLTLKNLLDKIPQSMDFIKKLRFAILNDKITKSMTRLDDSSYWDKIIDDIVSVKEVTKLRSILTEVDNYLDIFEISPDRMSSDTIRCIRYVLMSKKLLKLRDEVNNYSLWRNFVINILSDDTRCSYSDSKSGMYLVCSLIYSLDPELPELISSVSSVQSAIEIAKCNFHDINTIPLEYVTLLESLYDGSIGFKTLRSIIQFTRIDLNRNRSIQFDKVTELLERITSEEFQYLDNWGKFYVSEFIERLIYDSYNVLSKLYFRLNTYVNNRYIKVRNLFDEYLDRNDPRYLTEEFVIDNTYDRSDIVTKGRIKLVPITNGNISDIKTRFGLYIDDNLYFDPLDSQKISFKILREMTNVSDIYYNRKNRYEKSRDNELIKKLITNDIK